MYKNYSLYGLHGDEIEPVVKRVEELFDVKMDEHDSIAWGDYFLSIHGRPNEFSVYWNEEPESGEPHHSEFAEYELLLSIYDSTDMPKHGKILSEDPVISATLVDRDIEEEGVRDTNV